LNIHILIPHFTSCIAIGSPGRQAIGIEMEENDFAGKNNPPVAEPQEGCLNFYEMEKYGVRLSHNVLGD
jgi:hypothetical protein